MYISSSKKGGIQLNMKYYTKKISNLSSKIHIIEVPVQDFKIVMNDSKKKSAYSKNYCNAGFFGNFKKDNYYFTLPVGHLVCDYDAKSQWVKYYCNERGKFNDNKFTFDTSTWSYINPLYRKSVSTLLIKDNKAKIKDIVSIPSGCDYAISGIPIMRNGMDVSFNNYVKAQGWDSSPLYATWHIFIGLKKDCDTIYIIGMKTTTYNMVRTSEAFKKFEKLGLYDVIKLDGGGSFHMNINGKSVASTYENRIINSVFCF